MSNSCLKYHINLEGYLITLNNFSANDGKTSFVYICKNGGHHVFLASVIKTKSRIYYVSGNSVMSFSYIIFHTKPHENHSMYPVDFK